MMENREMQQILTFDDISSINQLISCSVYLSLEPAAAPQVHQRLEGLDTETHCSNLQRKQEVEEWRESQQRKLLRVSLKICFSFRLRQTDAHYALQMI